MCKESVAYCIFCTTFVSLYMVLYRLKEPILHLLWGLVDTFFSNRNLSEWNLEYKQGATVCIHRRKMVEIAPGVPPQGAKTYFVFFLLSRQRGLSATYLAPIRPFLKQQTWIAFCMRTLMKNFPISAQGVCRVPKQPKIWYFRVWCLWQSCSSNGTIVGDGNHFGG